MGQNQSSPDESGGAAVAFPGQSAPTPAVDHASLLSASQNDLISQFATTDEFYSHDGVSALLTAYAKATLGTTGAPTPDHVRRAASFAASTPSAALLPPQSFNVLVAASPAQSVQDGSLSSLLAGALEAAVAADKPKVPDPSSSASASRFRPLKRLAVRALVAAVARRCGPHASEEQQEQAEAAALQLARAEHDWLQAAAQALASRAALEADEVTAALAAAAAWLGGTGAGSGSSTADSDAPAICLRCGRSTAGQAGVLSPTRALSRAQGLCALCAQQQTGVAMEEALGAGLALWVEFWRQWSAQPSVGVGRGRGTAGSASAAATPPLAPHLPAAPSSASPALLRSASASRGRLSPSPSHLRPRDALGSAAEDGALFETTKTEGFVRAASLKGAGARSVLQSPAERPLWRQSSAAAHQAPLALARHGSGIPLPGAPLSRHASLATGAGAQAHLGQAGHSSAAARHGGAGAQGLRLSRMHPQHGARTATPPPARAAWRGPMGGEEGAAGSAQADAAAPVARLMREGRTQSGVALTGKVGEEELGGARGGRDCRGRRANLRSLSWRDEEEAGEEEGGSLVDPGEDLGGRTASYGVLGEDAGLGLEDAAAWGPAGQSSLEATDWVADAVDQDAFFNVDLGGGTVGAAEAEDLVEVSLDGGTGADTRAGTGAGATAGAGAEERPAVSVGPSGEEQAAQFAAGEEAWLARGGAAGAAPAGDGADLPWRAASESGRDTPGSRGSGEGAALAGPADEGSAEFSFRSRSATGHWRSATEGQQGPLDSGLWGFSVGNEAELHAPLTRSATSGSASNRRQEPAGTPLSRPASPAWQSSGAAQSRLASADGSSPAIHADRGDSPALMSADAGAFEAALVAEAGQRLQDELLRAALLRLAGLVGGGLEKEGGRSAEGPPEKAQRTGGPSAAGASPAPQPAPQPHTTPVSPSPSVASSVSSSSTFSTASSAGTQPSPPVPPLHRMAVPLSPTAARPSRLRHASTAAAAAPQVLSPIHSPNAGGSAATAAPRRRSRVPPPHAETVQLLGLTAVCATRRPVSTAVCALRLLDVLGRVAGEAAEALAAAGGDGGEEAEGREEGDLAAMGRSPNSSFQEQGGEREQMSDAAAAEEDAAEVADCVSFVTQCLLDLIQAVGLRAQRHSLKAQRSVSRASGGAGSAEAGDWGRAPVLRQRRPSMDLATDITVFDAMNTFDPDYRAMLVEAATSPEEDDRRAWWEGEEDGGGGVTDGPCSLVELAELALIRRFLRPSALSAPPGLFKLDGCQAQPSHAQGGGPGLLLLALAYEAHALPHLSTQLLRQLADCAMQLGCPEAAVELRLRAAAGAYGAPEVVTSAVRLALVARGSEAMPARLARIRAAAEGAILRAPSSAAKREFEIALRVGLMAPLLQGRQGGAGSRSSSGGGSAGARVAAVQLLAGGMGSAGSGRSSLGSGWAPRRGWKGVASTEEFERDCSWAYDLATTYLEVSSLFSAPRSRKEEEDEREAMVVCAGVLMRTAVEPLLLLGALEEEEDDDFEEPENGFGSASQDQDAAFLSRDRAPLLPDSQAASAASSASASPRAPRPVARLRSQPGACGSGALPLTPAAAQRLRERAREEWRERRKAEAVARWARGVGYPEAEVGWLQWRAIGSFLEQEQFDHPALLPMWGKAVRGTFKEISADGSCPDRTRQDLFDWGLQGLLLTLASAPEATGGHSRSASLSSAPFSFAPLAARDALEGAPHAQGPPNGAVGALEAVKGDLAPAGDSSEQQPAQQRCTASPSGAGPAGDPGAGRARPPQFGAVAAWIAAVVEAVGPRPRDAAQLLLALASRLAARIFPRWPRRKESTRAVARLLVTAHRHAGGLREEQVKYALRVGERVWGWSLPDAATVRGQCETDEEAADIMRSAIIATWTGVAG